MLAANIHSFIKDSDFITQKDICDALGMSYAWLSNILTGKNRLAADDYIAICDFIGVPYDFFVDAR